MTRRVRASLLSEAMTDADGLRVGHHPIGGYVAHVSGAAMGMILYALEFVARESVSPANRESAQDIVDRLHAAIRAADAA